MNFNHSKLTYDDYCESYSWYSYAFFACQLEKDIFFCGKKLEIYIPQVQKSWKTVFRKSGNPEVSELDFGGTQSDVSHPRKTPEATLEEQEIAEPKLQHKWTEPVPVVEEKARKQLQQRSVVRSSSKQALLLFQYKECIGGCIIPLSLLLLTTLTVL